MGVVIKQSGIASVFTYIGTIIGFVNTVVLLPAFLTTEQIGLFRALPAVAYMIMPIAQLGMAGALLKFAPEFKKVSGAMSQFLTLAVASIFIGFGIACTLIFTFKTHITHWFTENSQLFNDYFYISVVLIFIFGLHTIFEVYSRIHLKIIVLSIIREIIVKLLISCFVTLYFLQVISFDFMVNGLMIIYGIALLSLLTYIYSIGNLNFSFHFNLISKTQRKNIASYSLFSIIGSGGGFLILNIDQVMITSILGLEENGIYTTAFYFAVMIEIARRTMSQITTPLVSAAFQENDIKGIEKIYMQTSINQMIIGGLLFIGIVCNIDSVYQLMPNGSIYSAGKIVIFVVGASKLLDMIFANNGEIINMSNHFRFNVVTMVILSVLMITFNVIMIPIYGINGAGFATFSAMLIFNILKLIFIKIKIGILPFTYKNLILLGVFGSVLFIGYATPKLENTLFDLVLRSSVITLIYCSLVYFLKISAEINGIINRLRDKVTNII